MSIEHILRNGRKVKSIAGHVIKYDDFKGLYKVIFELRKGEHMNGNRLKTGIIREE